MRIAVVIALVGGAAVAAMVIAFLLSSKYKRTWMDIGRLDALHERPYRQPLPRMWSRAYGLGYEEGAEMVSMNRQMVEDFKRRRDE